ncbi:ATPase family AAA domain-containing protein 5 [Aulostomus maculatus]
MAGVVAMASVIEDFDSQPCKKSRKDGGSPVVKTITSYFSPVPKPAEKPFSPPRSNNIMDYFNRRSLPSKEKSSSAGQPKVNCQRSPPAEKRISPEVPVKPPSQKRRRKATKAARKLVEAEAVILTEEESCFIVEESNEKEDIAAESTSACGFLGSDTAALLAQLSTETSRISESATNSVSVELAKEEHGSKCGKSEPAVLKSSTPSTVLPLNNKSNQIRMSAQNSRSQQQEAKHAEPEEKEDSLCEVSMEVNVDEDSKLNNSTVMISFEDFVRSQSQDEEEGEENCKGDDSKIPREAEDMNMDHTNAVNTEGNEASGESSLCVSPRTVTIQAEVHAISLKQAMVKPVGKIASIFNRRKGVVIPDEEPGISSTSVTVKRKSNVVLQEEDLELAVIESESTTKCSEAEKKQFMSAFKQPTLDGSKSKSGRSQGKQRNSGERILDAAEKIALEDTAIQANKVAAKKPARKSKKTAGAEKEAISHSPAGPLPAEEAGAIVCEADDKREEALNATVTALRRSRREVALKSSPTISVRNTRKQDMSKDSAAASPQDILKQTSTPRRLTSKHGVFIAEMVCPPDIKESPIRIKFRRVHPNVSMAGSDINPLLASKISKDSKKQKKAKKLVEKAIAIQQSKKAAAVEGKTTLRRSSRTEASVKKSYCENEDSIICLEKDKAEPEKCKAQKPLRSLNDVLGKSTSLGKETRASPGSKVSSLNQEKIARRPSAVVSIFDESSHEGSENSQDGVLFRARREFLKSGLPESFRKQIAKVAATKEAYTLSSSSFQLVIHVMQPPNDCPLWSLPWPESSFLSCLKDFWSQTSNPTFSVTGSLGMKKEPAHRVLRERGSGWRPEISEAVRQLLVEEVSFSNPCFPAQTFMRRFVAKRSDHQQHCLASDVVTGVTSTPASVEPVGGKRKRMGDHGTNVAKKPRASRSEESSLQPEPTKRGGRTRRSQRARLEKEKAKEEPSPRSAAILHEDDSVVIVDDLLSRVDAIKEDVLWTDKYQPQHASDILGNNAAVRRLHSWLREWKLRADRDERNKKDKKHEEGSNDSDWDCGEENSQYAEDALCNTILITGPTGVGKTSTVYACAQELGFKVFEVNASSQRSGRLILSQLKEATQSHQVDSQGVNTHKPTYFNSYGTSSSAGSIRHGLSPRKINSPRRVVSSPRKQPQSPRGAKRGGLAPTSLANFFKMGRPTNKEPPNTKKDEQNVAPKKLKATEAASKHKDAAVKSPAAATSETSEELSKKTATSLILFEEVDVIFEDDAGFLSAIKTFMTTTKRPVILTTSDPTFSTLFDGNFEEIHFKTPSVLDVSSYLQLLCLAEDMRTDLSDVRSLLRLNGCDIRQSLLQLQYWTRSAGGRHTARPLLHTDKTVKAELKPETSGEAADGSPCTATVPLNLPPCDSGCTETLLGLTNTEPKKDIWELLRNHLTEVESWELLMENNRRGCNLLYSNMENLLPLPLTRLTSTHKPLQCGSGPPDKSSVHRLDALPSHARLLCSAESADCSEDGSPVKVSHRMRKNKRRHCLPDQDGLHLDSDTEECSLTPPEQHGAPQATREIKESSVSQRVNPLTPDERAKSLQVSKCLESIANFLEDMSEMDSSLVHQAGDTRRGNYAVMKDGMMDESRVEIDRLSWVMEERVLEVQAAVEALSFHKCQRSLVEAWDKAQQLEGELGKEVAAELTLPVASHHQGCSFTQDSPCQPQLVHRRKDVLECLMFRGGFGTLGNRSSAALDYLPALRTICRSEQLKEQGKLKRRFLHYLDSIHLGLQKDILQHLAEDFS